jgi:hypothetical protein
MLVEDPVFSGKGEGLIPKGMLRQTPKETIKLDSLVTFVGLGSLRRKM